MTKSNRDFPGEEMSYYMLHIIDSLIKTSYIDKTSLYISVSCLRPYSVKRQECHFEMMTKESEIAFS